MANPNWRRWIHSSVAVFLKGIASSVSLPALVEGVDDRSDAFMKAPDRIEFRVNGPFTQEQSHGYYRVLVDVNVVLKSHMGGAKRNPYAHDALLGLFHEAMSRNIPILGYSLDPDENDEPPFIGCLTPLNGKNNSIRVLDFGQIDRTDRIVEGMVDARYVAYLED